MTIVSNTTPRCDLTLIGHVEILPKLYGNIHITQTVLDELRHPAAPPLVRNWATNPVVFGRLDADGRFGTARRPGRGWGPESVNCK